MEIQCTTMLSNTIMTILKWFPIMVHMVHQSTYHIIPPILIGEYIMVVVVVQMDQVILFLLPSK